MPDGDEIEKVVDAWLTFWEAPDNSPERDDHKWAEDRLLDWRIGGDAESIWRFIIETYPRSMSDRIFSMLAAGPVEDLLTEYGNDYIEKVEQLARRDERFNQLLGGVWQNAMTDEVWARVQAARRKVW